MKTTVAAQYIDSMKPARLAPLTYPCDICVHEEHSEAPALAMVDAPTVGGQWGYLCLEHAASHAVVGFHKIGTRLHATPATQRPFAQANDVTPA